MTTNNLTRRKSGKIVLCVLCLTTLGVITEHFFTDLLPVVKHGMGLIAAISAGSFASFTIHNG